MLGWYLMIKKNCSGWSRKYLSDANLARPWILFTEFQRSVAVLHAAARFMKIYKKEIPESRAELSTGIFTGDTVTDAGLALHTMLSFQCCTVFCTAASSRQLNKAYFFSHFNLVNIIRLKINNWTWRCKDSFSRVSALNLALLNSHFLVINYRLSQPDRNSKYKPELKYPFQPVLLVLTIIFEFSLNLPNFIKNEHIFKTFTEACGVLQLIARGKWYWNGAALEFYRRPRANRRATVRIVFTVVTIISDKGEDRYFRLFSETEADMLDIN